MNTIAGIFYRTKPFDGNDFINRVSPIIGNAQQYWCNEHVAFITNKVPTQTNKIIQDKEAQLVITGDARLHNCAELAVELGLEKNITDLQIALAAYKKWPAEYYHKLQGAFSFVLYDAKQQTCCSVKDQAGQRPLYYYLNDEVFFFSNRLQVLSSFSFVKEFDRDWILDFLAENNTYRDKTIFKRLKD